MPRETHIERQVEWKNTLQKHGCHVKLEKTIHIKKARVVVDVYAKVGEKVFLIEIGDIDDERKNALMQIYAQQNPNIEFIHEGYGENRMQQVLSKFSSYRETQDYKDYLREVEIDREKWELRQRKGLAMLPNEVREKIQYPKETLEHVCPITRTSGGWFSKTWTDFWVITNQRLIFYWSDSCLEIKFEDFLSADIISKSGRRREIGLGISFLVDNKYAYRHFLLGRNQVNRKFIEGFKKNIEKCFGMWSERK